MFSRQNPSLVHDIDSNCLTSAFGIIRDNFAGQCEMKDMNPTEDYVFPNRGFKSKNRSLLAAMTNKQSHEDGTLSDEEITWLTRRAKDGFGIVTTAASHVSELGKGWIGEMGVWSDNHIEGLTKLASSLKQHGSLNLVQIFHGE